MDPGAVAGLHVGKCLGHKEKRGARVDGKHPVPELHRRVVVACARGDPGGIDQPIDAAEAGERQAHDFVGGLRFREVGGHGLHQGNRGPDRRGSRSTRMRASAPAPAAARAIAAPTPRAAPVIRMTMPSRPGVMSTTCTHPVHTLYIRAYTSGRFSRSHLHLHAPVFDPRRIGRECHANRTAERLTSPVVEPTIVLGALDRVVHHEAVGEVHLFVRAEPVGAPDAVVQGRGRPRRCGRRGRNGSRPPPRCRRVRRRLASRPFRSPSVRFQCRSISSAWNSAR
jgi:hypothetical protein